MEEKILSKLAERYGVMVQRFNSTKDPIEKALYFGMKEGAKEVLSSIFEIDETVEDDGKITERVTQSRMSVIM